MKLSKKTLYRILAMLLVLTMLGANATTLSFAADAEDGGALTQPESTPAPTDTTPPEDETTLEETLPPEDTETEGESVPDYVCGLAEHTHTEECYEQRECLVCGQEESDPDHVHVATCYWAEDTIICGKEETEGHTHTDECYQPEQQLTCTEEEWPAHTHNEACYETGLVLICTDEDPEHQHEATCYEEGDVLKCDQREGEGHTHDDSCYTATGELELSCGRGEAEGHTHTESCHETKISNICGYHLHEDSCYETGSVLICEQTEHSHTDECISSEESSITVTDSLGAVAVSGDLPETVELSVQPCDPETVLPMIPPLNEGDQFHFAYDISLLLEGAEYQPDGTVKVTVVPQQSLQMELFDSLQSVVYHITDGGEAEVVESQLNADGTITFFADGFSIYVGVLTIKSNTTDGVVDGVIYFDLAAGMVEIDYEGGIYKGTIYKTEGGTTIKVTVTGTHNNNNQYYVYQSSESNRAYTGLQADSEFYLPEYDRLASGGETWGEYITNNTSPTDVHNKWSAAAQAKGREGTANWIKLGKAGTYNVTIDNLWSLKNDASTSRTTGGIAFSPSTGSKAIIKLKGDNRFGNIHYNYGGGTTTDEYGYVNGTGIVFENGETGDLPGTMTVVSYNGKNNHYNSVIGGCDTSYESSCGIIINSGVIYAGARVDRAYTGGHQVDNCSAIGGGGNGTGVVTITGGAVTAVVHSTGAAIGGGIGESQAGGKGYVTIKGDAVVRAYNFGYTTYSGGKAYPVPAAAIGGASSRDRAGNTGNVTIIGNADVYAKSVGGAAIGGGSSTKNSGGTANVTIGGNATVTALSVGGTVNGVSVAPGVSIGGGTAGSGGSGSGGNATLVINGGTMKTGSIGGGACNNSTKVIGNADVTINGGTLQGQIIMAGGAGAPCKFTMTGGKLDNSTKTAEFEFLRADGGAVWMDDPDGVAAISGGTIENCAADNGGAVYMTKGKLYLTKTETTAGKISNCSATVSGGAIYLGGGTVEISGGSVESCSAVEGGAVYLGGGTMTLTGEGVIKNNTATGNGGGAYLASGALTISGGAMESNSSVNGGGAYLGGGSLTMSDGAVKSNTATGNGGGAYLSGGELHLSGGTIETNTANNGGGAYVVNGSIIMSGGSVTGNEATTGAGGGMYVSAEGADVAVTVFSGSVKNNKAATGGGAIAVYGDPSGSEKITVTVGLHLEHIFDTEGTLAPIAHDRAGEAGTGYTHTSCPVIQGNSSGEMGGGIHIKGGLNTALNVYCLREYGNAVAEGGDKHSNFLMVEGGKVLITSAEHQKDVPDENDSDHGNTDVDDSVHVVGGQVDLYGAMTNPGFGDSITVDIPQNDPDSYYDDHRYNDAFYKIIYFENFTDPMTHITSGRYTAYQVPIGGEYTILGVIYAHPGYEITGWFTDENASNNNTDHTVSAEGKYEVGESYLFDGSPIGDLILFAGWASTGYWVKYDANITEGSYTGSMGDAYGRQNFTYDIPGNLQANRFQYPGHRFMGWDTRADGTGDRYKDGAEILNLTNIKDAVVTLYAQWEACDHVPNDDPTQGYLCSHKYTVQQLSEQSAILRRSCDCGGQDLTIYLSAQDVVYDGASHPAHISRTDAAAWPVTITYTSTKGDPVSVDPPVDAGTYTCTVSDGVESISVAYTIEKAEQPAPPEPAVTRVGSIVTVDTPVANSPAASNDSAIVTQYRLACYVGSDVTHSGWVVAENGVVPSFTLSTGYTSFCVEVRYTEGLNYKKSPITRSTYDFYVGLAEIKVTCDEGLYLIGVTGNTEGSGGATISVGLDSEFYLMPSFGAVETSETVAEISRIADTTNFLLSNVPNEDITVRVHISGAAKGLSVTTAVTEREVFGTVSGTSATIERDAAFTAWYKVSSYDSAVYSNLRLSFGGRKLPRGATIILQDRSGIKVTWWSYTVIDAAGVSDVPLTAFTRMGTDQADEFAVTGTELVYQFVVDLSEAGSAPAGAELDMTLTADKAGAFTAAPDFEATADVNLKDKTAFSTSVDTLAALDGPRLAVNLACTSSGYPSGYEGRSAALILTPTTALPEDAKLRISEGNRSMIVYMNGFGNFLVPLSAVTEDFRVMLELVSGLFPVTAQNYSFEARWVASRSEAASAPMNGGVLASRVVTFEKQDSTMPSLRVTGEHSLLAPGDMLSVIVDYTDVLASDVITADLQRWVVMGTGGSYAGTGKTQQITEPQGVRVSLAGQQAGSFRLLVTIRRGNEIVCSVPYYFIIQ